MCTFYYSPIMIYIHTHIHTIMHTYHLFSGKLLWQHPAPIKCSTCSLMHVDVVSNCGRNNFKLSAHNVPWTVKLSFLCSRFLDILYCGTVILDRSISYIVPTNLESNYPWHLAAHSKSIAYIVVCGSEINTFLLISRTQQNHRFLRKLLM